LAEAGCLPPLPSNATSKLVSTDPPFHDSSTEMLSSLRGDTLPPDQPCDLTILSDPEVLETEVSPAPWSSVPGLLRPWNLADTVSRDFRVSLCRKSQLRARTKSNVSALFYPQQTPPKAQSYPQFIHIRCDHSAFWLRLGRVAGGRPEYGSRVYGLFIAPYIVCLFDCLTSAGPRPLVRGDPYSKVFSRTRAPTSERLPRAGITVPCAAPPTSPTLGPGAPP
jgi:hypothetical protein